MKKFFSVNDVVDLRAILEEARNMKANPFQFEKLGQHKTLGLIFLNPSLRTRLSTQKAGMNLGMQVMVMNMGQEGWALETRDGVAMDGTTVEHIREAAASSDNTAMSSDSGLFRHSATARKIIRRCSSKNSANSARYLW